MSAALHPEVEGIGRQFKVVGAATPSAFARKAELDAAHCRESAADRLDHYRTNWIGRCLANFGVAEDIAAVVNGEGIAPRVYAVMQRQLLSVNWVDGIPVIMPVAVDRPQPTVKA